MEIPLHNSHLKEENIYDIRIKCVLNIFQSY